MENKKQKTRKTEVDATSEIVKKIKSTILDVIVREWLNTPDKEWGNKTPLQMIKAGHGPKILDAIKLADEELKQEKLNKNVVTNSTTEEDIEETRARSCSELI